MDSVYVDARFKHLVCTNASPSDAETHEIRDIISQERAYLSALASQIKDQEAILQKLLLESTELSNRIHRFEATISPVRRIPPELVAEIFQLCCPTRTTLPPCHRTPQLILTQICSGWRKVALELKPLWNCVLFTHTPPRWLRTGVVISQADIEHAGAWISHAGSMPLDLALNYRYYDSAYHPVRTLLLPHVRQCRDINLFVAGNSLRPLIDLPMGSFDMLESLKVSINIGSLKFWPSALKSAPRLHSLIVESEFTDSDLQSMAISTPWSQLTHFEICGFHLRADDQSLVFKLSSFFNILQSCTTLVECYLDLGFHDSNADDYTSIVVLPRLRALRLADTFCFDRGALILFQHLTLPALEELEITFTDDFPIAEFASLASRSAFTLKKLAVRGILDYGVDVLFANLLHIVSDLQVLDLLGCIEARNLTRIAEYELVPRLHTLGLVAANHIEIKDELLAMIQSRRPRHSHPDSRESPRVPLETLTLKYFDDQTYQHFCQMADFHQWKADGLDIRFVKLPLSRDRSSAVEDSLIP